eukprot:g985.t1
MAFLAAAGNDNSKETNAAFAQPSIQLDSMSKEERNKMIIEHGKYLGLTLDAKFGPDVGDNRLLWLVEEALRAKLPKDWEAHYDATNESVYYYNTKTDESTWVNPIDDIYRQKIKDTRKQLHLQAHHHHQQQQRSQYQHRQSYYPSSVATSRTSRPVESFTLKKKSTSNGSRTARAQLQTTTQHGQPRPQAHHQGYQGYYQPPPLPGTYQQHGHGSTMHYQSHPSYYHPPPPYHGYPTTTTGPPQQQTYSIPPPVTTPRYFTNQPPPLPMVPTPAPVNTTASVNTPLPVNTKIPEKEKEKDKDKQVQEGIVDDEENQDEFITGDYIERIIDHHVSESDSSIHYKVHWKGTEHDADEWFSRLDLVASGVTMYRSLVAKYEKDHCIEVNKDGKRAGDVNGRVGPRSSEVKSPSHKLNETIQAVDTKEGDESKQPSNGEEQDQSEGGQDKEEEEEEKEEEEEGQGDKREDGKESTKDDKDEMEENEKNSVNPALAELQERIAQQNTEIEALNEQLEKRRIEFEACEGKLTDCQSALKELRERAEAETAKSKEIDDLVAAEKEIYKELALVKGELEMTKTRLTEEQKQNEDLTITMKREIASAVESRDAAERQLKKKTTQIEMHESSMNKLKKELNDEIENTTAVQRKVIDLEEKTSTLSREKKRLEELCQQCNAGIQKAKENLKAMEDRLKREGENAKIKIEKLEETIASLKLQRTNDLQTQKQSYEEQMKEMKGELTFMRSSNEKLLAKIETVGKTTTSTKEEHEKVIAQLESSLEQEKLRASLVLDDNRTLKMNLRETEMKLNDAEETLAQTTGDISESHKTELAFREERIEALTKEIETLNGESETLLNKIQNLQQELAQVSADLDDAKAQNKISDLENRKKEEKIQKQLDSLRSLLQKKDAQLSNYEETLNKVQNEREQLKQCKSELQTAKEERDSAIERSEKLSAEMEATIASRSRDIEKRVMQTARDAIESSKMEADRRINEMKMKVSQAEEKYDQERIHRRMLNNRLMEIQGNIRVFCRSRPLLKGHDAEGCRNVLGFRGSSGEIEVKDQMNNYETGHRFEFDHVFDTNAEQKNVFTEVRPFVISALEGFNVCVFAYGQTGSGKTHTMIGGQSGEKQGVFIRTLSALFDEKERLRRTFNFTYSISMLEIYNENIIDLLATNQNNSKGRGRKPLDIRRGRDGTSFVDGLTDMEVKSMRDVIEIMDIGNKARTTGSHDVNLHSSRSHLVLTCRILGRSVGNMSTGTGSQGGVRQIHCKLNLIDLAGSERLSRTGASGERLREAKHINKSLSALGDVIQALGKSSPQTGSRGGHVPFRNSKLTHLLQDSLSGNSKVLMFVCVSPTHFSVDETLCSLKFAERCRAVKLGMAKANIATEETMRLRKRIFQLEKMLKKSTVDPNANSSKSMIRRGAGSKLAMPRIKLSHFWLTTTMERDFSMPSLGRKKKRKKPTQSSTSMASVWNDSVSLQANIPKYDALNDKYCTYTKSKAFKVSPFGRNMTHNSGYAIKRDTDINSTNNAFFSPKHLRDPIFDHFLRTGEFNPKVGNQTSLPNNIQQHNETAIQQSSILQYYDAALAGGIVPDFVFEHHEQQGSRKKRIDELEVDVFKAIMVREGLLQKMSLCAEQICELSENPTTITSSTVINRELSEYNAELQTLLGKMRIVGVVCVERIQMWRSVARGSRGNNETIVFPNQNNTDRQFFWNSKNYLLKMTSDLNFLNHVPRIQHFLSLDLHHEKHESKNTSNEDVTVLRNPFLMWKNLDTMKEENAQFEWQTSLSVGPRLLNENLDILRVKRAVLTVLHEEHLYGLREEALPLWVERILERRRQGDSALSPSQSHHQLGSPSSPFSLASKKTNPQPVLEEHIRDNRNYEQGNEMPSMFRQSMPRPYGTPLSRGGAAKFSSLTSGSLTSGGGEGKTPMKTTALKLRQFNHVAGVALSESISISKVSSKLMKDARSAVQKYIGLTRTSLTSISTFSTPPPGVAEVLVGMRMLISYTLRHADHPLNDFNDHLDEDVRALLSMDSEYGMKQWSSVKRMIQNKDRFVVSLYAFLTLGKEWVGNQEEGYDMDESCKALLEKKKHPVIENEEKLLRAFNVIIRNESTTPSHLVRRSRCAAIMLSWLTKVVKSLGEIKNARMRKHHHHHGPGLRHANNDGSPGTFDRSSTIHSFSEATDYSSYDEYDTDNENVPRRNVYSGHNSGAGVTSKIIRPASREDMDRLWKEIDSLKSMISTPNNDQVSDDEGYDDSENDQSVHRTPFSVFGLTVEEEDEEEKQASTVRGQEETKEIPSEQEINNNSPSSQRRSSLLTRSFSSSRTSQNKKIVFQGIRKLNGSSKPNMVTMVRSPGGLRTTVYDSSTCISLNIWLQDIFLQSCFGYDCLSQQPIGEDVLQLLLDALCTKENQVGQLSLFYKNVRHTLFSGVCTVTLNTGSKGTHPLFRKRVKKRLLIRMSIPPEGLGSCDGSDPDDMFITDGSFGILVSAIQYFDDGHKEYYKLLVKHTHLQLLFCDRPEILSIIFEGSMKAHMFDLCSQLASKLVLVDNVIDEKQMRRASMKGQINKYRLSLNTNIIENHRCQISGGVYDVDVDASIDTDARDYLSLEFRAKAEGIENLQYTIHLSEIHTLEGNTFFVRGNIFQSTAAQAKDPSKFSITPLGNLVERLQVLDGVLTIDRSIISVRKRVSGVLVDVKASLHGNQIVLTASRDTRITKEINDTVQSLVDQKFVQFGEMFEKQREELLKETKETNERINALLEEGKRAKYESQSLIEKLKNDIVKVEEEGKSTTTKHAIESQINDIRNDNNHSDDIREGSIKRLRSTLVSLKKAQIRLEDRIEKKKTEIRHSCEALVLPNQIESFVGTQEDTVENNTDTKTEDQVPRKSVVSFEKVVGIDEATDILKTTTQRYDVEQQGKSSPEWKTGDQKAICKAVVDQLKFVVRNEDEAGTTDETSEEQLGDDGIPKPQGSVNTNMFQTDDAETLNLAIGKEVKQLIKLEIGIHRGTDEEKDFIGTISIDDSVSLEDLRLRLESSTADTDDLLDQTRIPPNFRFVYNQKCSSRSREKYRYVHEVIPRIYLVPFETPSPTRTMSRRRGRGKGKLQTIDEDHTIVDSSTERPTAPARPSKKTMNKDAHRKRQKRRKQRQVALRKHQENVGGAILGNDSATKGTTAKRSKVASKAHTRKAKKLKKGRGRKKKGKRAQKSKKGTSPRRTRERTSTFQTPEDKLKEAAEARLKRRQEIEQRKIREEEAKRKADKEAREKAKQLKARSQASRLRSESAVMLLPGKVHVIKGKSIVGTSEILAGISLQRGDQVQIKHVKYKISTDENAVFNDKQITLDRVYEGNTDDSAKIEKVVELEVGDGVPSYMRGTMSWEEHQKAKKKELDNVVRFCGYQMTWGDIIPLLGKGPLNKTKEQYWDEVPEEFALTQTFKYLCRDLKPVSDKLDGAKWAKFAKMCPDILDSRVKSTDIDLIFNKCKAKGERKLTYDEFKHKAMQMLAELKYPWMNKDKVLYEFLRNHVFVWEKTESLMWKEARRLAIIAEGKQQCAAKRLQSYHRMRSQVMEYHYTLNSLRKVQDRFRIYLLRLGFLKKLVVFRREQAIRLREIAERRKARQNALLFREARYIDGRLNIVTVYRHSKRDMIVIAYNPKTCETFHFNLLRDEYREMVRVAMGDTEVPGEQLFLKKYMRLMVNQLMYKKRFGKVVIIMSKKGGTGDRGDLVLRKGKIISGQHYVVDIIFYMGTYVFKAYRRDTSKFLVARLTKEKLWRWFDYSEKSTETPELLRLENREKLLLWFLDRIFVCEGCGLRSHAELHRRGESILMLEYEKEEQREYEMACKLQGLWKQKKARDRIRLLLKSLVKKQFDPNSGQWYYLNSRTGEVSWDKPLNMGSEEIPDPPDRWERMTDGDGNVYYFHAPTGRTSWMSMDEAATFLQRMFRKSRANDFRITDFSQIVRALKFQRDAEENYKKHPDRLSSIINYALLNHTIKHDHKAARAAYKKALEISPNNPVVLYGWGLFLLAESANPRRSAWEEGQKILYEAQIFDRDAEKFQVAIDSFFHWAVVVSPQNALSMMNYALIQQCIKNDYNAAEKFYRRALDCDSTNRHVTANYEDFAENRLPGGLYAGGGPGDIVRKRSEIVLDGMQRELPLYFWQKMRDPIAKKERFALFYYNVESGKTAWEEPNWQHEWTLHRKRGVSQRQEGLWEIMYDEKAPEDFQYYFYNFQTDECTFEQPW